MGSTAIWKRRWRRYLLRFIELLHESNWRLIASDAQRVMRQRNLRNCAALMREFGVPLTSRQLPLTRGLKRGRIVYRVSGIPGNTTEIKERVLAQVENGIEKRNRVTKIRRRIEGIEDFRFLEQQYGELTVRIWSEHRPQKTAVSSSRDFYRLIRRLGELGVELHRVKVGDHEVGYKIKKWPVDLDSTMQ